MDSWITILITLALLIIPAISKAKKEKAKAQMEKSVKFPEFEESSEEDDDLEKGYEEDVVDIKKDSAYVPLVAEGGAVRVPEVPLEFVKDEIRGEVADVKVKKKRFETISDKKNLIIYSEIMKPKFKDF